MKQLKNDGSVSIQFTMRMESKLYERLKQSATNNRRSITKELETATEKYLNDKKQEERS